MAPWILLTIAAGPRVRERWLRSPRFGAHLEFHRADCAASHGDLRIYQQAKAWLAELPPLPPPPLCTGRDVLALGVEPGPAVGRVLRLLQARLDDCDQPDRELALSMLRTIVEEEVKMDG